MESLSTGYVCNSNSANRVVSEPVGYMAVIDDTQLPPEEEPSHRVVVVVVFLRVVFLPILILPQLLLVGSFKGRAVSYTEYP